MNPPADCACPCWEGTRDTTTCQPTRAQHRCVVQFGALEAEAPEPGVWTVSVAKQSALPAAITVRFTPL